MNRSAKTFYLAQRGAFLHRLAAALPKGSCRSVRPAAEIKNILFIRIDRIGDMVLSTPAIRALKGLFPDARLTVLASPANHALLQHEPDVDEVVVFDNRAVEGIRNRMRLVHALRDCAFDAVVDPMPSYDLHTALLTFYTQAPLRVGFPGAGREVFYNRLALPPPKDRHFVDLTLDAVRELGAVDAPGLPSMVMAEAEIAVAREWMQRINPRNRRVVGIHPGAYYPSQRWPIQNFIRLAGELQNRCDCCVVLLGAGSDQALLDEVAARLHEPPAVFQNGDLREVAAVMSLFRVLVCNNSGPLHLAAALGVPTVSFMGPTNARRWWPMGSGHCVLRRDDLSCLGCEAGVCPKGSLECLESIHPNMAFEAVKRILEKSDP